MIFSRIWTKYLCGARGKVCYYRIDRYALPGDNNTGLAGCPEIDRNSPHGKGASQGEGSVFFSQGAVSAYRKQAHAGAFASGRNWYARWRTAHIDKSAIKSNRGLVYLRHVSQPCVQSADEIQASF